MNAFVTVHPYFTAVLENSICQANARVQQPHLLSCLAISQFQPPAVDQSQSPTVSLLATQPSAARHVPDGATPATLVHRLPRAPTGCTLCQAVASSKVGYCIRNHDTQSKNVTTPFVILGIFFIGGIGVMLQVTCISKDCQASSTTPITAHYIPPLL